MKAFTAPKTALGNIDAETAAALAEDGFDTGAVPIVAPLWPLHSALLSVWHTRRSDSASGMSTPWPSGDAASIHLLHGPSGAGVEVSFRRNDVVAPSSLLEDAGSDIPVELLSMHVPALLSAAQVCAWRRGAGGPLLLLPAVICATIPAGCAGGISGSSRC